MAITSRQIGKQVCEMLGLPPEKVRSVHIHVPINELVTVDVEFLPEDFTADAEPIFKQYRLVDMEADSDV